jgi:hypothetical protein
MTASEDGTSDYNCVDVIREAGATVVAAAQSTTSLVPPLGNDKAKVLTLNLRNRLIFRSADEADAVQAADFIGKKRVVKRSWGFSAGRRNVNYSETEEHKIKPHKLRNLRDHECVLVHCERGLEREIVTIVGCFATAVGRARASDLIASVSERHTGNLRVGMHSFPLPIATPEFTISLLWHLRMDADQAHRWLRGHVRNICAVMR